MRRFAGFRSCAAAPALPGEALAGDSRCEMKACVYTIVSRIKAPSETMACVHAFVSHGGPGRDNGAHARDCFACAVSS